MRILHVNKFVYRRGGAEGYMLDVAAAQEAEGHDVAFYAMAHPDNIPTRYEDTFPSSLDFGAGSVSIIERGRIAGRMLYSTSARRGIGRVIERFQPDIVHLHNIYHQLSPSILAPIAAAAIPSVMTLHDYKLACPTYKFLDDGEICQDCLGGKYSSAIRRRCNRGSLAASSLNALEMTLHTRFGAYGSIDLLLCPSKFLMEQMQVGGVYPDKLRHIPNFVDVDAEHQKTEPGGNIVFFGRLSEEKGIDTLIRAMEHVAAGLDIVGDGPERAKLEALAGQLGVDATFHGRLPMDQTHEIVRAGITTALVARWYENQPLAVLESYANGVPVVGSDIGGLPELIEPGISGYMVRPDQPTELAEVLQKMVHQPDATLEMGRNGYRMNAELHGREYHLGRLEELYGEAMHGAAEEADS